MHKLNKQEKELIQRINEVLFYIWDPIGVNSEPEARDEYDSYVLQVFSILLTSNPKQNLKQYLFDTAKKEMKSEIPDDKVQEVVELLIDWKYIVLN